jgi:hypothetical protein
LDHYLTWAELGLVGTALAFPAVVAAGLITLWHLRLRIEPPHSRGRALAAAGIVSVATLALSFVLWPIMNLIVVHVDSAVLMMVLILIHPPGLLAGLVALVLGSVIFRFIRRHAGSD